MSGPRVLVPAARNLPSLGCNPSGSAGRLTYVSSLRSWRRAPGSWPARRRAPRPPDGTGVPVSGVPGRPRCQDAPTGPAPRAWWPKIADAVIAAVLVAALLAWVAVIGSPRPSRTLVLTAAALCAAATATMTALLAARVRAITRLRGHGQPASAQVTSVRRIFFTGSDYYGFPGHSTTVTVSFTDAAGRHITGQYYARLTDQSVERPGHIIQIVYDPRRPVRFRLASDDERAAGILIGGLAVVAVCLAVTAWLFFRAFS